MPDDLFAHAAERSLDGKPLAERMRPRHIDAVVGQQHLLGPRGPLRQLLAQKNCHRLFFGAPPVAAKPPWHGCWRSR